MNERQQEKPNNQCLDMGLLVGLRDENEAWPAPVEKCMIC